MFTLGITGHANIEKSNNQELLENGNIYNKETYKIVFNEINRMVKRISEEKKISNNDLIFVSGMARGADEIFALYAIEKNIPLIASIPYSLKWHRNRDSRGDSKIRAQAIYYDKIIDYINSKIEQGCKYSKIVEVPKLYNGVQYKYANFARNQNIIDESDGIISYYKYKSVGTTDAIKKAKLENKYLGNVSSFGGNIYINKVFSIKYDTDLFTFPTHILIQGCNCFNTMGAGIAKIIKDKYPEAFEVDKKTTKGNRDKLGSFTYADVNPDNEKGKIKYIVNAYSQFTYWDKEDMFYIEAFEKSITAIIENFIKKRKGNQLIKFSLPAIGLGLANGDIKEIYNVLQNLSNKYENSNIELNLCLHPKDIALKEKFKELDNKNKEKPI